MTTSSGNLLGQGRFADRLAGLAAGRAGLVMFSLALLTSASLLFSVQPLFAKMVLPYLGGSPSVWAVAMCFFQAALLAGYCYAHALNRFVPSLAAPLVHLAVCAGAVLMLPFALPEWAADVPGGNSYLWLLSVLAVGVGLPFFAASANAPLLQAWFARSGHPHANDPYFLYGASNLGSLVSLLSYPFLIEPMLGVDAQRNIWAVGFVMLMVMIALCAILMISNAPASLRAGLTARPEARPITLHDRLGWISLALIPSALLVAFTTHITTDVASAPFLWVIPLATFLGTFVIVFRERSLIPHGWVLRIHPILVAAALVTLVMPHIGGSVVQGILGFATFVVTTLVCHRALYDVRPASEKLTEFYLYMSLGGVLGGMFAALVAPQIFNTVAEYPLLIVAGLFARPGVMTALRTLKSDTLTPIQWGLAIGPVALIVILQATGIGAGSLVVTLMTFVALVVAAVIAVFASRKDWLSVAGIVAVLLTLNAASLGGDGISVRSFFGVSRVIETADGRYRLLVHGSTTHGGQKLRDESGKPIEAPHPVLYYHSRSPMARGFDIAREAKVGSGLNVGVVGLGTGALACSLKVGETISYFEIDPVVVDIARNPKHFTFLSECAPSSRVVLGDARLTIGKEPAAAFDYLVIDAFSSDAVPVHLLTREAIELYLSKVAQDGLIAFHISNRHMELESVVAATAATLPGVHMAAVLHETDDRSFDDHPSHVMYVSRSRDVIARAKAIAGARAVKDHNTAPWSDNYADILSAIWRQHWK